MAIGKMLFIKTGSNLIKLVKVEELALCRHSERTLKTKVIKTVAN